MCHNFKYTLNKQYLKNEIITDLSTREEKTRNFTYQSPWLNNNHCHTAKGNTYSISFS